MRSSAIRRYLPLLLAIPFALASCEEPASPDTKVEPTYASIREKVFAVSCASASCHNTRTQAAALVLEGDAAYDNLVNRLAENDAARGKGLRRVSPGNPDSSFLVIKITGPREGEGDRMPYNNDPLSQQAIDAIRTWIANGAQR